jgi:hypothetical protein
MAEVVCLQCGEKFSSYEKSQKYCCLKCYWSSKERIAVAKCVSCGKEFETLPCKIKYGRKYCSLVCSGKANRAKRKPTTPRQKAHLSKLAKQRGFGKWYEGLTDEKHCSWLGDDVGYGGLHQWVIRKKGKPKKCEQCGKTKGSSKSFHWSNIDHKYRRNLEDYVRLCASCHKKYDLEMQSRLKNKLSKH